MKRILRMSISLLLFAVCLFSFSFNALAFDNEYISNMGKWYKEGDSANFNNGVLSGQVRYVLDENNACAYFYISYSGCKGNYKDKDVSLKFDISNSSNKYSFSVSKSGVKNSDKNIYVEYDFENINVDYGNGRLLVGFEMKNKADRSKLNKITCNFSAGSKNSCTILEGLSFDMYVDPTTVSQRNVTTKSRTVKSHTDLTSKVVPKTTKKQTSKSSSKSTKFVPKHTMKNRGENAIGDNSKNDTTKFSGNADRNDKSKDTSVTDSKINEESDSLKNTKSSTTYNSNTAKLSYSKESKLSFKIAVVLGVLGVAGLCYGLLLKDNKTSSKDDDNADDN